MKNTVLFSAAVFISVILCSCRPMGGTGETEIFVQHREGFTTATNLMISVTNADNSVSVVEGHYNVQIAPTSSTGSLTQ